MIQYKITSYIFRCDFESSGRFETCAVKIKITRKWMARRKFRHSQRRNSSPSGSFQDYLANNPAPQTSRTELIRLIKGGEDTYLELKVKLSNSEKIAQEIVALANTAGGTIIFGVSDQLRIEGLRSPGNVQEELIRICREEIYPSLVPFLDTISFDDGRRVVAIDIVGKNRPYRTRNGKFFWRIGSEKREATREELSGFLEEIRPLYYENIPVSGFTEKDFDDSLLWSFADGFERDVLGKKNYDTANFLKKDLLLAVETANIFLPTVAGVLLFGKNEKVLECLPQSKVIMTRYVGNDSNSDVIETEEFGGNLLTLNELTLRFIERYCDLWKYKSKEVPQRKETPVEARGNYNLYSVREAVANMLVHRDLALLDIETRVSIYDDSIELINPRRTNGFVPLASKAIRFGITQKINPQISAIFSRREYGVAVPRGGLPMILKQASLFSGKRTELYTSGDQFKLKLHSA